MGHDTIVLYNIQKYGVWILQRDMIQLFCTMFKNMVFGFFKVYVFVLKTTIGRPELTANPFSCLNNASVVHSN